MEDAAKAFFYSVRIPLCPGSVPDPNPETLGPPGSGSVIICTDPDSDPPINKQKNKKNLDFYTFGISSLKTGLNVTSNRSKTRGKSFFFCWHIGSH